MCVSNWFYYKHLVRYMLVSESFSWSISFNLISWDCNPLWERLAWCIKRNINNFNWSNIGRDIIVLTLTFSVNGPLTDGFQIIQHVLVRRSRLSR